MLNKCGNIERMFAAGYRPADHGEWLDAYNKTASAEGVSGTILAGINYRNMHFVLVEL